MRNPDEQVTRGTNDIPDREDNVQFKIMFPLLLGLLFGLIVILAVVW